jgi:predicted transcriptional regulator
MTDESIGIMSVDVVEPGDIVEGMLVISVHRSVTRVVFTVLHRDSVLERFVCITGSTVHCAKYQI